MSASRRRYGARRKSDIARPSRAAGWSCRRRDEPSNAVTLPGSSAIGGPRHAAPRRTRGLIYRPSGIDQRPDDTSRTRSSPHLTRWCSASHRVLHPHVSLDAELRGTKVKCRLDDHHCFCLVDFIQELGGLIGFRLRPALHMSSTSSIFGSCANSNSRSRSTALAVRQASGSRYARNPSGGWVSSTRSNAARPRSCCRARQRAFTCCGWSTLALEYQLSRTDWPFRTPSASGIWRLCRVPAIALIKQRPSSVTAVEHPCPPTGLSCRDDSIIVVLRRRSGDDRTHFRRAQRHDRFLMA